MNEDDRVELLPCPYVLGPISDCDDLSEDGGQLWQAEVQTMGGHGVAATIYAGTEDAARQMAERAIAAWNTRAPLQGADTVTEAMLDAGSRVLCRAYELDDGWDEKQAEKHAASEMGLNFRCEARDCYTAMRTAAPTAQDDTGARLDAVWDELQSLLPQSGVGGELQSAWDRLQCLINVPVRGGE